jgi:hypothetical protein
MSILIKCIEMPKSCVDCPCSLNMFFCRALDGREVTDRTGIEFKEDGIVVSRPDWCPLVEVPEKHGDLIDTDRLLGVLGMSLLNAETCNAQEVHTVLMTLVMPLIASQPIIIEAEDKK